MTTPAPNDARRATAIRTIAKRELSIGTLDERKSDSLDFHEVSVWGLKAALAAAYEAGRDAERRRRPPTRCKCPACGREIHITPLT